MATPILGDSCNIMNTGQKSVGTSGTDVIVAAWKPNPNSGLTQDDRRSIVVTNPSTTVTVYIGGTSGVTTSTGHALPPGQSISFDFYRGAIYGVVATSTQTVTYCEEAK